MKLYSQDKAAYTSIREKTRIFSTAVSATAMLIQSAGSEQKLQAFNECDTYHTPWK